MVAAWCWGEELGHDAFTGTFRLGRLGHCSKLNLTSFSLWVGKAEAPEEREASGVPK